MEGLPALLRWEIVWDVFSDSPAKAKKQGDLDKVEKCILTPVFNLIGQIDYVPCTLPKSKGKGRLVLFEDNDAVIQMCNKGRSPTLRHVPRTHRVDLDWLWERVREDPGVFVRYVGTKEQMADIFTKGSFSSEQRLRLCRLAQIGPQSDFESSVDPDRK